MNRRRAPLATRAAVCLLLLTAGAGVVAQPGAPLEGRFAREVVLGEPGGLEDADVSRLSTADREALQRYLTRRDAHRPAAVGSDDTDARRQVVERAIVGLIDREDVSEAAPDVARTLDLAPGTMGTAEEAQRQADAAERYLRAHPRSPAAAFLYAFIAGRCRLAIEASADIAEKERLARKYRTMLDRLRHLDDGAYVLLARDLDAVSSLSGKRADHPREYLPPG